MYICGVKFQEHYFNSSRNIIYSVFSNFSCKQYDGNNSKMIKKKMFQKENAILL